MVLVEQTKAQKQQQHQQRMETHKIPNIRQLFFFILFVRLLCSMFLLCVRAHTDTQLTQKSARKRNEKRVKYSG